MLLVTGERIPASVQKELKRLDPDRIVVLGGPATVGESVLGQLRRVAETSRIGGADRYAVSAAVAERAFPETGGTVYVSSGQKFPDALSGSAAAIRSGSPVLLVTDSVLPTDVAAQLARLKPERVVILGGESSVSEAVARAVQSATAG